VAVVAVVRHAAAWIALTATGALKFRARRAHFVGEWAFLGAVVAGTVGTAFAAPVQFQTTLERGAGLMAVAALAIALAAERLSRVQGKDMGAFVASAVSLVALLGLWATGSYPVLVHALDAHGPDLTLAASAAPMSTLIIVTICGAACLVGLTSWAALRRPPGIDGRTQPP
jgi:cytochrome bd ubiquinol oxidase subunit II